MDDAYLAMNDLQAPSIIHRILWTIVIVAAFALMIHFVVVQMLEYQEVPVVTEYNLVSPPGGVKFPVTLVCPFNYIHRWTHRRRTALNLHCS